MNKLPYARQLFKFLNEDNGKLKAEKCLGAGQRHAAFQQHFLYAVRKVRLTALLLLLL